MSISLSGKVGPLALRFCLYNAAGVMDTSKEQLMKVLDSEAGAVVSKSCTYYSRVGNPQPRYFYSNGTSTNSTGLANHGYKYYFEQADSFRQAHPDKPYFVSIASLNPEELEEIIHLANQTPDVSALVFNFSCPNIVGKTQLYILNKSNLRVKLFLRNFKECLKIVAEEYKNKNINLTVVQSGVVSSKTV